MPLQKKKTAIDFGDEEAVLADVAAAMEADIFGSHRRHQRNEVHRYPLVQGG